jgi:hypothetical protein
MVNSSPTLLFRLVSPSSDDLDFGGIVLIGDDDRRDPATVDIRSFCSPARRAQSLYCAVLRVVREMAQ